MSQQNTNDSSFQQQLSFKLFSTSVVYWPIILGITTPAEQFHISEKQIESKFVIVGLLSTFRGDHGNFVMLFLFICFISCIQGSSQRVINPLNLNQFG